MVPSINGIVSFERALEPGDVILVIPDYFILPSVQEASDVVNEYSKWMWSIAGRSLSFKDRPLWWARGHKPMSWRYSRGVRLFTINHNDCIGLFNMGADIKYSAGCHDIYVMKQYTYMRLKHTTIILDEHRNYTDRYDLFVEESYKKSRIMKFVHDRNPFKTMDFSDMYPRVDTYVQCTPDAIVEEMKEKVLAEFKVGPLPPGYKYKYDSAAYQKIVASREAMKRAEIGESEAEAIVKSILNSNLKFTMPIPKFGDFELKFDKVPPFSDINPNANAVVYVRDDGLSADALRYCVNDVLATNELFENRKKEEENETMKQNNKTTGNAKTLTGYVTDISVTHAPYDLWDDSTVKITLQVPNREGYLSTLADADIKKMMYDHELVTLNFEKSCALKPKKVIFNNPATIVLWNDGTKTVVTRQKGDRYNKEEGLALCYMKKALGNSSRVFNDALHAGLEMGEK